MKLHCSSRKQGTSSSEERAIDNNTKSCAALMGNAGTKATRISSRHKAADSVSKLGNKSSVEFESRVDAELQKKMAEIRSVGNQEGKPGEKGGNHLGAQGGDESTVPELPDGPGLHDLFKMIESRTHVFAQDADKIKAAPSKQVSEEMKKNRIESKELRKLMEHVSSMDPKSSSLDVGALAAHLGIPEDSLAKVIRYYSLPSIRRTVDGRLVAQSDSDSLNKS